GGAEREKRGVGGWHPKDLYRRRGVRHSLGEDSRRAQCVFAVLRRLYCHETGGDCQRNLLPTRIVIFVGVRSFQGFTRRFCHTHPSYSLWAELGWLLVI